MKASLRTLFGAKPTVTLFGALLALGASFGTRASLAPPARVRSEPAGSNEGEGPGPLALGCASESALYAADAILSRPAHPCRPWFEAAAVRSIALDGRVGEYGAFQGSGALLADPSGPEPVPFVSALHVVATGGSPEGDRAGETPTSSPARPGKLAVRASIGAHITDAVGGFDPLALPIVPLPLTLPLGAEFGLAWRHLTTPEGWQTLPPASDFFFGLAWPEGGGRWASGTPAAAGRSGAAPPHAAPPGTAGGSEPTRLIDPGPAGVLRPGASVLAVGFPMVDGSGRPLPSARNLYGIVLRVADEAETEEAARAFATSAGAEAEPPYEASAEVLLRSEHGTVLPGMSGGGVFDGWGRLVAIVVRADEPARGARRYARAVRLAHAASEARRAHDGLPAPLRGEVAARLR
jgi:hypothetical protein